MKFYAIVTGASKGIGKAIAHCLARRSYNLILVARSENELREVRSFLIDSYPVKVDVLALDLSLPGAALQILERIKAEKYPVSILVNNAGYGIWGNFGSLSIRSQMNMLQLNINALVELTYHLLPELHRQDEAYILNVASTAAYQAVPTLALYSASKAFVLSFTRALRFEMKKSSVSVTCLSPGPVDTAFAERAGVKVLTKMTERLNMKPEDVAEIAVQGMFTGKSEIIPGITNIISAYANRLLPKSLVEKVAARIYKV